MGEVRDVLLSGGDALLLSDKKLGDLLGRLRAIDHIEFLRIGSRVPIFLPQRITPELCAMLKDKRENGGRDFAALLDHVAKDGVVLWGWNPGGVRAPAPRSPRCG